MEVLRALTRISLRILPTYNRGSFFDYICYTRKTNIVNMFTVYSKRDCAYCQSVLKLLTIKKFEYEVKVLGRDFTREQFVEQFGVTTFPQVYYNEELLGGAKDTAVYIRENLS